MPLGRRFWIYALGNSVNNMGNAFYLVALPLLVYHLTGSSLSMAVTVATEALSTLLLPFWGVWVDRASPRQIIVGALLFQAGVSAVLPLSLMGHWITVMLLYAISFFVGTGANVLQTAQTRIVPLMFPRTRDAASATLTTAYTVTTVLGPFMAGLALAHHGEVLLLWVNSASFIAPILLLPWTRIPTSRHAESRTGPIFKALRQGVGELVRQPPIRPIVATFVALRLTNAVAAVFAVYRLKHAFHAPDALAGLLFVALGVGGIVGTRVPLWLHGRPLRVTLLIAVLANMLGVTALMTPWVACIPVGLALTGAGFLAVAVTRNLWLQRVIPVTHLARANTTIRTLTGVTALGGTLVLGVVSASAGVDIALAVLLVASALSAVPLLTAPAHAQGILDPPA